MSRKGNFPTLLHLGYVDAGEGVSLRSICENGHLPNLDKLKEENYFAQFREGDLSGVIWFNKLLKKWMCDVSWNGEYVETLMREDVVQLLADVYAFYSGNVK